MFLLIKNVNKRFAGVLPMNRQAASRKPKFFVSGGNVVVKLKLKGIYGRSPPEVEPVA